MQEKKGLHISGTEKAALLRSLEVSAGVNYSTASILTPQGGRSTATDHTEGRSLTRNKKDVEKKRESKEINNEKRLCKALLGHHGCCSVTCRQGKVGGGRRDGFCSLAPAKHQKQTNINKDKYINKRQDLSLCRQQKGLRRSSNNTEIMGCSANDG